VARLITYGWPGNVRELENAIERAVALGSGPLLHVGNLLSNLQHGTGERMPQSDELLPLEELERRAILRALHESGGDKLAAARLLGIGRRHSIASSNSTRPNRKYNPTNVVKPLRLKRYDIPCLARDSYRTGKLFVIPLAQLQSKP
jgi:hypothetical protein